ncbi:MAG: UvrD-helicase domain-containing protein [Alphaproteobacteria bacterium]|nr:UvrD-helicase domain-containing protein [Alphaproteobacteria bacterium]
MFCSMGDDIPSRQPSPSHDAHDTAGMAGSDARVPFDMFGANRASAVQPQSITDPTGAEQQEGVDGWGNLIHPEDAAWYEYLASAPPDDAGDGGNGAPIPDRLSDSAPRDEAMAAGQGQGEGEGSIMVPSQERDHGFAHVSGGDSGLREELQQRIFQNLNPPQQQAVETIDGPLLVIAGAGSGKTRVLTHRLAWIIASGSARPWQTLTVTFTNKAAREMRERIESLLGAKQASQLFMGTFHSVSVRILRRHAELLGFQPDFHILDRDDSTRVMKEILEANGVNTKRTKPQVVVAVIDGWKNDALFPEDVHSAKADAFSFEQAYAAYQKRLLSLNAMDFGDLILFVIRLLTQNPDIMQLWQQRFRYLMIDEYQDTNTAQFLWLKALVGGHSNVCCVGDDDQSIYGWRGAKIENVFNFDSSFPGGTLIRLEINYRSTGNILRVADQLIGQNKSRMGKRIVPSHDEVGAPLAVVRCLDDRTECDMVVSSAARIGETHSLSEIAVLVRAGHLTRGFEESFLRIGVPYRIYGGMRFYEREEIRDAIAYLRIIRSASDDLALLRIINKPVRGIGTKTIQKIQQHALEQSLGLLDAIPTFLSSETKNYPNLVALYRMIERWQGRHSQVSPAVLLWELLEEVGYLAMWENQQTTKPDAKGRLENLKELQKALTEFASLGAFLDHVALVMDNDSAATDRDSVGVMTIHAAKGLEFDYVFLPAWEEGVFPNQRALEESEEGIEEERRLAYVALTRARKEVCISYTMHRQMFGSTSACLPSRFLQEIDGNFVRKMETVNVGGDTVVMRDLVASSSMRHWRSRPGESAGLRMGMRVKGVGAGKVYGTGVVMAFEGRFVLVQFDIQGRRRVLMDALAPCDD